MIKIIVFDMGGVLIDWNPVQFLENYKLSKEDKDILLTEVFRSYQWVLMDYGKLSVVEGIYQMQKNLPSHLKKYATDLVMNWPIHSKPIDGMYDLVCKLKDNGYDIFLLSNAANNQPEYWKRYPYYFLFDKKIISYEYGTIKPEKAIYDILLSKFDLKAEECVFIDDNSANVAGAVMCNMNGIVFNNCQQLIQKLKELKVNI